MTLSSAALFSIGTQPPALASTSALQDSQLWLSQSILDLQMSPDPRDHQLMFVPQSTYDGVQNQEPNLWYFNGYFYCLYAANTTPENTRLAFAQHPMGPWTRIPGVVVGSTTGTTANNAVYSSTYPFAGPANNPNTHGAGRGSVYIENNTLYYTYNDQTSNTMVQATAPISQPMNWTINGSFTQPIIVGQNGTQWGTPFIIKALDGQYHMFAELSFLPMGGWQIAHCVASSINGPWQTVQAGMPALLPGGPSGTIISVSAAHVIQENGLYVMYYHASTTTDSMDSDIYRAYSYDLYRWTVDNNGAPVFRRRSPIGVEQIANVRLIQMPNTGDYYAMYEAANNVYSAGSGTTQFFMTRLLPVLKKWDGIRWSAITRAADPMATRGYSDLFNDPVILNVAAQTYTAQNLDDVIYNPSGGSASNATVTLPFAYRNNRCRITNANSSTGTVVLAVQGTDNLIAAGTLGPIAPGKSVEFFAPAGQKWCGH